MASRSTYSCLWLEDNVHTLVSHCQLKIKELSCLLLVSIISRILLLSVFLAVVTTFVDETVVKCILVKHISVAAPAVYEPKEVCFVIQKHRDWLFCKLWERNMKTNILPTTIQYHKEFVQERELLE
ncbi:hypothetical protein MKW92_009795 [Papaver armeniacum]|nr:hypothetical protein MKW92_009795 [Papaver armeniacum]